LEFSDIKKGLIWPNIKIKKTKIKGIGHAGPEAQAIYIYIWLGSAQLVQAGLGQASLAWSLCVHA